MVSDLQAWRGSSRVKVPSPGNRDSEGKEKGKGARSPAERKYAGAVGPPRRLPAFWLTCNKRPT
jgi:hypothetical protein